MLFLQNIHFFLQVLLYRLVLLRHTRLNTKSQQDHPTLCLFHMKYKTFCFAPIISFDIIVKKIYVYFISQFWQIKIVNKKVPSSLLLMFLVDEFLNVFF